MIEALLRGKLSREIENMEDVLTSSVFGVLRYLEPTKGILPFLSCAEDRSGEKPLKFLQSADDATVEYEFWPPWEEPGCHSCEPDVVLTIKTMTRSYVVLIEAKHLSGKSSCADDNDPLPCDQLAKECHNLFHVAKRKNAVPYLVYLNSEMQYACEDIEGGIKEFNEKLPQLKCPEILWLSWRHLNSVADVLEVTEQGKDLLNLCERLQLCWFGGFVNEINFRSVDWKFKGFTFDWALGRRTGTNMKNFKTAWRFNHG